MSSVLVPYAAPWQTGFERFATQLYTPTPVSFFKQTMTIPANQWWRIIYLNATFVYNGGGTARSMVMEIDNAKGSPILAVWSPTTSPITSICTYLFGPYLTTFSSTADPTCAMQAETIPDLLWPPGATIFLSNNNNQAADTLGVAVFAVEVYTEQRPGVFVPVATPVLA